MLWLLLIIVIAFLIFLIYALLKYSALKGSIETRSRELFENWKKTELETQTQAKAQLLFQEWKQKEEQNIREDAINRSKSVIGGKITEHLIPFLPEFAYDPQDARFIGSPVDFIVFDGLSDGELKNIVFIEVKSGKTATLSQREKQIKDCIQNKNVTWEIIHHKIQDEAQNSKE